MKDFSRKYGYRKLDAENWLNQKFQMLNNSIHLIEWISLHFMNHLPFKSEVLLRLQYISPHQGSTIQQPDPYTISYFSFRPAPLSPCNFLSLLILSCQVCYCYVRGCCSIILSFSSHLSPFSYIYDYPYPCSHSRTWLWTWLYLITDPSWMRLVHKQPRI